MSVFAPLAAGLSVVFFAEDAGLGKSERMKVRVWKSEKVAKGTRVKGIGDWMIDAIKEEWQVASISTGWKGLSETLFDESRYSLPLW